MIAFGNDNWLRQTMIAFGKLKAIISSFSRREIIVTEGLITREALITEIIYW